MILDIFLFAGKFYLVFLVLNILIIGGRWRRIPAEVKVLLFFLLIALGTEVYSRHLLSLHKPNLFLLHYYTGLEFLSWSLFYYCLYRSKGWSIRWISYLIGFVSLLLVANTIFLEPLTGFNSNAKTLVQISLVGYSIYFFFKAFGQIDLRQPLARGHSFLNFAVLLYYSGSLFIFMFSKLLSQQLVPIQAQHGLWAINMLLLVLLHLFIFIGICQIAFRKTTSS